MITLLHGDNITASRKEIDSYKIAASGKEIVYLSGSTLTETDLIQALESNSLFGNNKLVIIENLLGGRKKLEFENILNSNQDKDIILWESKEIGKTIINKLPKSTNIKLFKIPTVIFKFLDSLTPLNIKYSLNLFHESLKTSEPEMVFFMMIRQFRNLLIIKDLGASPSLNPWQARNLTNQAKSFTMDKLMSIYQKLLQIDLENKTGASPFSLTRQIELLIINFSA